ncbi:MAG: ABC transporter permease, partial [Bacteroidales bacterium]|nr:ABC transporter permease [Bacteroidales bacterium]
TDKMLERPGGTGGYLLWAESAVPVKEDLMSESGRMEYDLNEEELKEMFIVQCSRVSGDDASCLNLNYVASPPLLGVDQEEFIKKEAFSFASGIKLHEETSPWELLGNNPDPNTVYGIADQTVLQWGLQVRTGDTLVFSSENGQPLNIIIGAGLKSSVFQGYLLISKENLSLYYPSVEGGSVFLVDGRRESSGLYRNILNERLSGYGFSAISAGEKLASFFRVTNTYLNVFAVFGAFGMILGITGLGFVLLRNYNIRKREFAFLSATGYTIAGIRKLILRDQLIILTWGVISGAASGIIATLPSIRSGSEMPWSLIIIMILVVIITGTAVLSISVRRVKSRELILRLRKE